MTKYLCRLCGAHYQGSHTCNGAGNWEWTDSNKIYDLQAQIAQLTAELAQWRKDAERLAKTSLYDDKFGDVQCVHCGYVEQINDGHSPNCPITLHRELVEKYKVTK